MRSAAGVLSGMSLKQAEPFWTHATTYKHQKILEMGNLGLTVQQRGVHGEG